jgi:hypothetical protein
LIVRLSANRSRAGGVSGAKGGRGGKRSPHARFGPRSTWMNSDRG